MRKSLDRLVLLAQLGKKPEMTWHAATIQVTEVTREDLPQVSDEAFEESRCLGFKHCGALWCYAMGSVALPGLDHDGSPASPGLWGNQRGAVRRSQRISRIGTGWMHSTSTFHIPSNQLRHYDDFAVQDRMMWPMHLVSHWFRWEAVTSEEMPEVTAEESISQNIQASRGLSSMSLWNIFEHLWAVAAMGYGLDGFCKLARRT